MISKEAVMEFLNKMPSVDYRAIKQFKDDTININTDILKTKPYDHQIKGLACGLVEDKFLFFYDMGTGKMLRPSEPVLTPTGWVEIGKLNIGDEICDISGGIQKVTNIFSHSDREMYKITFTDNTSVVACSDHLWNVNTPVRKLRNNKALIRTTKNLFDEKLTQSKAENIKYFIPLVSDVCFKSQNITIDPYLLGVLLGDGGLTSGGVFITSADEYIINYCNSIANNYDCCFRKYSPYTYGFSNRKKDGNKLRLNLISYNLFGLKSKDKFIPSEYLFNDSNTRINLLRGLLDTDGHIDTLGNISFSSISRQLKEGVKFLVHSIGGTCTEVEGYGKYKGKEYSLSYRLYIKLPEGIIPFMLKRKADRVRKEKKYNPTRGIKTIEYVGKEDGVCITVSSEEGLYIIHDFIVTHNSKIVLDTLTFRRTVPDEDWNRALVVSPNASTVETFCREIKKHSNFSYLPLMGTKDQRLQMVKDESPDINVINYTGLLSVLTDKGDGGWVPNNERIDEWKELFDVLILDEIHLAKNHKSLTFNILKRLGKDMKLRYGLTGTPINRDPLALWAQFYLIDRGETLGKYISLFREAYFTAKNNYWGGIDYKFKTELEENLNSKLANKSLRYAEWEANELPEKVVMEIPIELSIEGRKWYQSLIDGIITSKGDIEVIKSSFQKLRRVCSGYFQYVNSSGIDKEIIIKENNKLDGLIELIQESPDDSKVVVFLDYIRSGDIVCDRLKKEKISFERLYGGTKDKVGTLDNFENRTTKVLVANTKSGGVGLNLQFANYAIFFELPLSNIDYMQAVKRVHRTGQDKRTFIYHLLVKNSIEEKLLGYINEGKDLFQALIEGKEKWE